MENEVTVARGLMFILAACSVLYYGDSAAQQRADDFGFPVSNYESRPIVRGFGDFAPERMGGKWHVGDDVTAPAGTPVFAIANGTVKYARKRGACDNNWGHVIVIEHHLLDNTVVQSVYAHLDPTKVRVAEGESVLLGTELGEVGRWIKLKTVDTPCWGDHLHFGIRLGEFGPVNTDYPSWLAGYLPNGEYPGTYCDPMTFIDERRCEVALQPGPGSGKDIWTTSVFSYCCGGGGPGGGLDDFELVVGGWGDSYYALIEFDLTGLPVEASTATLELFPFPQRGLGTTGIYVDRITESWDWKTQRLVGRTTPWTGQDMERLWWSDRPTAVQWLPDALPAPTVGQWYRIDITGLYNAWQDGTHPNHGLQLRPVLTSNRWNEFYSSDYLNDPSLRPRLVVGASLPDPSVSITATPRLLPSGSSTTVEWSATDVESCEVTGPNDFFSTDFAGIEPSGPITGESFYTIVCQSNAGLIEDTVRIIVLPNFEEF